MRCVGIRVGSRARAAHPHRSREEGAHHNLFLKVVDRSRQLGLPLFHTELHKWDASEEDYSYDIDSVEDASLFCTGTFFCVESAGITSADPSNLVRTRMLPG